MANNTAQDLKAFFSTENKPVSTAEYMAFWKSLSEEEKAIYRTADLSG